MECALCLAVLWPGALYGHGLGSTVGYQQTLGSMSDSVYAPVIILLIAGFALMAGTSGTELSKHALTAFATGLLSGFPAAPYLGPHGAMLGLTFGLLCALYSAASLNFPRAILLFLGFSAGAAATIHNLDGHPLASLPFAVHLGVFFGPLLLAAALTGWIGMILQATTLPWVRIIFRIFSSWCFAANAIFAAFQIKAGL